MIFIKYFVVFNFFENRFLWGLSSILILCFCFEILILIFIFDFWGIMMGFDNFFKFVLVLIVYIFGELLLFGMCIVLVLEKVSVVLVVYKKFIFNMNE